MVPSYAWSLTPSDSFLAQALRGDFTPETLERLCWEMVSLCNKAFVLDEVDFANTAVVRTSLERVHAYVNIGLAYLSNSRPEQLVPLLTARSLPVDLPGRFFSEHASPSAGFAPADAPQLRPWSTPGSPRARPARCGWPVAYRVSTFFVGLESPGDTAYRDFLYLQDIHAVDVVLHALEHDPPYRLPAQAA